jgi:hypothetical protein
MKVEGYTITEMAGLLKISPDNVLKRLQRKGIKPKNREVLYEKSALDAIRTVKPVGRPPKQPEPTKPAKKAKK